MRYESLILPPAQAPVAVRERVRTLFRHPGRGLLFGLLLVILATELSL